MSRQKLSIRPTGKKHQPRQLDARRFPERRRQAEPSVPVDKELVSKLAVLFGNSFKLERLGLRFPDIKRERIPNNTGRATVITVDAQIAAQEVELAKYEGL